MEFNLQWLDLLRRSFLDPPWRGNESVETGNEPKRPLHDSRDEKGEGLGRGSPVHAPNRIPSVLYLQSKSAAQPTDKIKVPQVIRRLKHNLRFWRTDLTIAVNLLTYTVFAGLLGGLLWGLAGVVGCVLATLGTIQLLEMIP